MTNFLKFTLFAFVCTTTLFVMSCNDDTPTVVDNCAPSYKNQVATGSFMGDAFTFVDGKAKESSFDSTEYRFTFYGETPTGDMCDNFNFDLPDRSIIFSLPQQVGTYTLGTGSGYSLTFNDITPNGTEAEIALCGEIEIQAINQNNITGRLHVKVENDSTNNIINGNFDVTLCN